MKQVILKIEEMVDEVGLDCCSQEEVIVDFNESRESLDNIEKAILKERKRLQRYLERQQKTGELGK
jgi:hypothetical protein